MINKFAPIEEKNKFSEYPLLEGNDIMEFTPANIGRPKVWAQTRQELCESLDYFRAWQSGVYFQMNTVYGFLVDGFGSSRDVCNGRVIISHGNKNQSIDSGGKSFKGKNGKFRLIASQLLDDSSIKSLINNYLYNKPVVLLIGNKKKASFHPEYEDSQNQEMEVDKVDDNDNYEYNKASLLNNNKTSKVNNDDKGPQQFMRWKFRFEWIREQQYQPWWESPSETISLNTLGSSTLKPFKCPECSKSSSKIFKQGCICLNHECIHFWELFRFDNVWESIPKDLEYVDEFLRPGLFVSMNYLNLPFSVMPPPLTPSTSPLLPSSNKNSYFKDFGFLFWRGFHCRRCGRLSCRKDWRGWKCLNCNYKHFVPHQIIEASMLSNPHRLIFIAPAMDCEGSITKSSDITIARQILSKEQLLIKYNLPEGGYILHLISNKHITKKCDDIFRRYQAEDMPFRRNLDTEMLSRQFTFCVGEEYIHAIDANRLSFEDAPSVVTDTFNFVLTQCKNILPTANFNQTLSIAYLIDQMKSLNMPSASPESSASLESLLNDDFKFSDVKGRNNMPIDSLEFSPNTRSNGPPLILTLHHGDIVIMVGHEIQKCYEHIVEPKGFRIALTFRNITSYNKEHEWKKKMDKLIHEILQAKKDYSGICNKASTGDDSGNVSSYKNMFRVFRKC
ncbi:6267_t:CDS:10 [Entrophospora sp. SA101]|nr:6267_t:CDS:10 [Entrophospora sp. SA101]